MKAIRMIQTRRFPLALVLAAGVFAGGAAPAIAAVPDQAAALIDFSAGLSSGRASVLVTYYPAPVGKAVPGASWQTFLGSLVFQRPDRLRLVLTDSKGKALGDSAAMAGKFSWNDAATGKSGSGAYAAYVDAAARVLLADKQSLSRDFVVKEMPRTQGAPYVVRLTPRVFGSNLASATVWTDGKTISAMEFQQRDRSRIYFAMTAFEPNAVVKASEFVIQ
jgi:outer membrane lipoprotein-sorting protein